MYLGYLIDFYHRSRVHFPCGGEIVNNAKNQSTSKHDDAIVHLRSRRCDCRGPETEEEDYYQIANGENVIRKAKFPPYTPWTPLERRTWDVDNGVHVGFVGVNVAFETVVQQQGRGHEVGSKEPDDGQGDDVVERRRRAEDD